MASLRDLLYPLPLEALSALAVSWDASDPREASLRARAFLLEANLMDDTITTVHIQNVFDKLLAAAPHLLPTSCPVTLPKVPCLTAVCGACSQPLATHPMLSARMLTCQRGLVPVLVEEKGCPTCGLVFSGCWVLPPTGGLRLAACPSPKDPFLIQPVRESLECSRHLLFNSACTLHVYTGSCTCFHVLVMKAFMFKSLWFRKIMRC